MPQSSAKRVETAHIMVLISRIWDTTHPVFFYPSLLPCNVAKKDLLHSSGYNYNKSATFLGGKWDINRTKAFFPELIVWYAHFEEKYLMCSNDFAPDFSYIWSNNFSRWSHWVLDVKIGFASWQNKSIWWQNFIVEVSLLLF